MIIVATSTSDYHSFPSTACLVQHALGANNAGAFDIQAACTGFIYALEVARGMMMVNPLPTLVIGADLMSRIVDWSDRNSCILFGDAAGAVVLEASNIQGGIWHSILKSDGSGSKLLYREGGSRQLANGPWMKQNTLEMQGRQVFNFAVKIFDEVLTGLLNHVGYTFDDLAWVIPHQANARIVEAVARRMSVPLGKFFMNMETTGNTSAASIPVALDDMVRSGRIKDDELVAMVGFGAGLTYGGMLMRWRGRAGKPKSATPPPVTDVSANA
jgi:3-oxoacyl-[acyl-carrier-protein] synthase-3